jgi:hypothetical protein
MEDMTYMIRKLVGGKNVTEINGNVNKIVCLCTNKLYVEDVFK